MPGDLVAVFPMGTLTGYIVIPALYLGKEYHVVPASVGTDGYPEKDENISMYLILFKGNVMTIPARTHKIEVLDDSWVQSASKIIEDQNT